MRYAYARFGQGMMLGDLSGIGHHAETATGAAEDATPLQPPQGSALIPSARTSRGPKGPPWRTRSIRRSAWVSATCASRMLDTTSVPHCLRRVDRDLHYPDDLNGAVHHDGQIWSRALWDIRGALGHVVADKIILEGQFGFAPDTTMPAAAQATVDAAQRLYGRSAAKSVSAAFQARGILP